MKTYYQNIGLTSGSCGHKHETIDSAVKCLNKDMSRCIERGVYNDRMIELVEDRKIKLITDENFSEYLYG